jgi:Ca2+-binding RTX toxin-like protein
LKNILSLLLLLFPISYLLFTTTAIGELLSSPAKTAFADHSNHDQFNPDDNEREREQDAVQELYGLNIIRGSTMIEGTNRNDFIIGSLFEDTVIAKDGDDEIQTQWEIDQVYAGDGDDSIQGGLEGDQLFGQNGEDNIVGGEDDDLLVGGPGDDHLFGGIGDDQLKGNSGADYFNCGDELDTDEVKDYNPAEGDIIESNCEIVFSSK